MDAPRTQKAPIGLRHGAASRSFASVRTTRRRNRQPPAAPRELNRTVTEASCSAPSMPTQPTMTEGIMPIMWRSAIVGAGLLAVSAGLPADADDERGFGGNIKRVLLIKGFHQLRARHQRGQWRRALLPKSGRTRGDRRQLSGSLGIRAFRFVPWVDGVGQRRFTTYSRRLL